MLLDSDLRNPINWLGSRVEYHLGHKKYLDFSTTELVELNMKELVALIEEI